jgi:predicted GNAT family N-acyltransferase
MPDRTNGIRIALADWWRDADAIRRVRADVFIREQGIPARLEWDGRDADCEHVLAQDVQGQALATARLMPDGRIGRMAVLDGWRRRGIGRRMLELLLQQARQCGLRVTYLHAQLDVADFYRKAGFRDAGEPFVEAGLPHVHMHHTFD